MAEQIKTKLIKQVGVVGAGQMGSGIAHVAALAGYEVRLHDISADQIAGAIEKIDKAMARQVDKGKMTAHEKQAALAKILPANAVNDLSDCDIVIEAATENEAIKTKIFEALCSVLKDDAILATNTSSLPVTRLAATTDRPLQFVGIHFFNPVPVMKLVELIRGMATDETTFQSAKLFAESLGKTVTESEDYPGFIVNRILLPMINEAVFALYEGVGSVTSIDNGMKLGCNHPMGPLELADFIGLDTCLSIMQVLYEGYSDSKYRPCPLLVKYVEAGWLGRKSGKGFYDYKGETPVPAR